MTRAEQARVTAWRFRILQSAGDEPRKVAQTCRRFGISRTAFYRWKKRSLRKGPRGSRTVPALRGGLPGLPRRP